MTSSRAFERLILGVILLAAVVVGLETDARLMAEYGFALKVIDKVILGMFTAELALKLGARGRAWPSFFRDPWNVFDFAIVAVCYLPLGGPFVAVLRLARVLRVLRLVTALPKLQILVGALLKSIPSMGYVALLLGIHFYVYAVLGVFWFGRNDPVHFGSIPAAALTLFQVVTLEGWVELMKIQMHGSAVLGGELHAAAGAVSQAQPAAAVVYFVSFILLGTMIILNLLIGVIMNGMEEARAEEEAARQPASFSPRDELERLASEAAALAEKLRALRASDTLRP